MDGYQTVLYLLLSSALTEAWQTHDDRRYARELSIEQHQQKQVAPRGNETKKRYSTLRPKELRKKPSGYLKPLKEDDMENDEVVSVAVGPPVVRSKYEKLKRPHKQPPQENYTGTNFVKDILTQLGREFLNHRVSEDFVFGQYVGNSMKNLTNSLKLKMQHEVLEIVIKYQKINHGEIQQVNVQSDNKETGNFTKENKEKKLGNENDEGWPDFSNLAKIVG